jgi:hypothetical protein
MQKKKIWANFQRIIELFTQKIVTKLSKIWVWYLGSGKNLFRIRIRNTAKYNFRLKNLLGEIPQKICSVRFSRLKRNDFKISLFKNTQYQGFIITQ